MPRGGGERGGANTRARGGTGRGRGRGSRGRGASQRSAPSEGPAQPSETPADVNADQSADPAQSQAAATESASSLPAATTSTHHTQPASSSSRTSSTPSATATRGVGRFRPKNVRRAEDERKKLEQARLSELQSKIKAEERENRAEERRNRRGRGRGRGAPLRGGLIRTVTAQGPFSALPPENVKSWNSGSGSRQKAESDGSHIRYRPRREHEARVNIDLLNGLTDGFAEDGTPLYIPERYTQNSAGNLPVGMLRTRHEEIEVKVKTQAELEAEDRQSDNDDDLFVDMTPIDTREFNVEEDNEIWNTFPPKVKPEVSAEDGDVEMADIPEAPKAPLSPDTSKKPVQLKSGEAMDVVLEKQKRMEKKKAEDPEFMNMAMDIEALLRNLQFAAPDEGQEDQEDRKDNQLFIFQLPPILPPLAKPGDVDLTLDEDDTPVVKPEDGAEQTTRMSSGLPPDGGYIGKLNVRKSGKVELDWGGTTLDLGMETQTDFLTTAVIVEQKEHVESAEESAGVAYGMGQVYGKFVLAPPCDAEEDWDPELPELS